jgi:hypothetical protein
MNRIDIKILEIHTNALARLTPVPIITLFIPEKYIRYPQRGDPRGKMSIFLLALGYIYIFFQFSQRKNKIKSKNKIK